MFAVSVLEGSVTLPSVEEMTSDQEYDYRQRVSAGLPIRFASSFLSVVEFYFLKIALINFC